MKLIYPAVFHQNSDGRYEGYFPDLDQCTAQGETIDDVVENANEAASIWIGIELEEDNAHLPPVTDLRDISLKEGEFVRNISVSLRFMEGWEE